MLVLRLKKVKAIKFLIKSVFDTVSFTPNNFGKVNFYKYGWLLGEFSSLIFDIINLK